MFFVTFCYSSKICVVDGAFEIITENMELTLEKFRAPIYYDFRPELPGL